MSTPPVICLRSATFCARSWNTCASTPEAGIVSGFSPLGPGRYLTRCPGCPVHCPLTTCPSSSSFWGIAIVLRVRIIALSMLLICFWISQASSNGDLAQNLPGTGSQRASEYGCQSPCSSPALGLSPTYKVLPLATTTSRPLGYCWEGAL